jgi:hypothetical protein
MSKYDDKVIPTLDDVIRHGVLDDTQIGDLSALEDDFDDAFDDAAFADANIKLDASASLDDDGFEAEFDKIYLASEVQQDTANDEISIDLFEAEVAQAAPAASLDFNDSIADLIVAESFPPTDRFELDSAPAEPARKTTASQPAPAKAPSKAVTKAKPAPAATATPARAEIEISKVVDEITRKLMPEIEWKIRTLVRDSLEHHFNDKK